MAKRLSRLALVPAWLALAASCGAQTPDELLNEARSAIAAGEVRTAEIHLKNLLQSDPDNVTARILLADVSLTLGDAPAAEQDLRRALALGADASALQVRMMRALIGQRRFDEAVAQFESGPNPIGPAGAEAQALEGVALRALGRPEQAEAAYRAALGLDARSALIRTELAALLLDTRRLEGGRALLDEVLADEPDFLPALLLRGGVELRAGQTAAAEATLQRVVDLERARGEPTTAYLVALSQLAETQLALGKVDAAAASADALLAVAPQAPYARYAKAIVEVQQGDLDAAERRLEGLIAEAPEFWAAYRELGKINVTQNQLGQATMYLRTAVSSNPADSAARLQLAELYIRQGDIEEARRLMESSQAADVSEGVFLAFAGRTSQQAGLDDQAAEFFRQSEAALPNDAQQLVALSDIYVAAGEFERAVRVLQSASFEDIEGESLRNYLLALVQARQGDLAAADATAQTLVESQPTAAWPLNLRGTIALLAGRLDQAQELLAQALEIEPRAVDVLLNSARVAIARNEPSSAQRYLERVVEVDAGNAGALAGLAQLALTRRDFAAAQSWVGRMPASPFRARMEGEVFAANGRFDEAASAFARAFDAQPSARLAALAHQAAKRAGHPNPEAKLEAWSANNPQDPTANFLLGSVALEKNQYDAATARFEAVLSVNPQHAATLNNLAWLYSRRGDGRALDYAERAYAAEPNNPGIADTLGWLYVQRGDAAKGLPLLAAAAEGLGSNAEVKYHWGVALAQTGDAERALAALDEALASGAAFDGRDDAERRAAALRASPR